MSGQMVLRRKRNLRIVTTAILFCIRFFIFITLYFVQTSALIRFKHTDVISRGGATPIAIQTTRLSNKKFTQAPSDWPRTRFHSCECRPICMTTRGDAFDKFKRGRAQIVSAFESAGKKFKSRPSAYLLIPVIAAFVGWFTNYLAVQMIFYPIKFRGLPIWRKDEVPLGLLGWQGIVPCKTRAMSEAMVQMVTTQLLSIDEVFRRLDPHVVASKLGPEVPKLMQSVLDEKMPIGWIQRLPNALFFALPRNAMLVIMDMNRKFLSDFTISMQNNIGSLCNVRNCVIDQMMQDRSLLGKLFWRCGEKELNFLTISGLWFGFLLGIIQMVVALFWENPWALSIGGTIVGLATNWLALKWIFEPVNPTKFGPFVLQGQFLRRQKEVAAEFSSFFAKKVLTSEQLWKSILTDPGTKPSFEALFRKHIHKFALMISGGFGFQINPSVVGNVASKTIEKLPNHLHVLHPYVDKTLQLQKTLQTQMEQMSSEKFERVLHPIFEEDELTLILAGGFLGFLAGLIQQGIETGLISFPNISEWVKKKRKGIFRMMKLNKR